MATNGASSFWGELTPRGRLSKAKIWLNKLLPFYSYLVGSLTLIEKPEVGTMAVDMKGRMYYNPKFVETLTNAELMGVLCHEVQHPALRHFQRQGNRNVIVNGGLLWNIAVDIVDNYLIMQNSQNGQLTLPKCGIIPQGNTVTVYGITVNNIDTKSAEEIYEELLAQLIQQNPNGGGKQKDKQQGNGQGQGQGSSDGDGEEDSDSNGQGGGKGKGESDDYTTGHAEAGFDEHIYGDEQKDGKDGEGNGDVPSVEEADVPNVNWDKVVAEAFNHAKMIGKAPAGFERFFNELHKPKINWRAILRKTIASFIPFDYTYRKPNRKYIGQDICMPSVYGEAISVVCSIDTSGSISQEDLDAYISEMIGIAKSFDRVEFRILSHDTDVHTDLPINNGNIEKIKQLKVVGGGGTDHRPLFNHVAKNKRKWNTELLVSFTDGYSSYPDKNPKIPTIFVLSGGHCPKEQMPSWGKVLTLD